MFCVDGTSRETSACFVSTMQLERLVHAFVWMVQ